MIRRTVVLGLGLFALVAQTQPTTLHYRIVDLGAFDSTPNDPNWNADADQDEDGAITVYDYNLLSANFDLTGDE